LDFSRSIAWMPSTRSGNDSASRSN